MTPTGKIKSMIKGQPPGYLIINPDHLQQILIESATLYHDLGEPVMYYGHRLIIRDVEQPSYTATLVCKYCNTKHTPKTKQCPKCFGIV